MTEQQKKDIQRLRKYKRTYAEISEITGVSINTIKVFFHRNKQPDTIRCKFCGKNISQDDSFREKHFCDRRCYRRWWECQPGRKRTEYKKTCAICEQPFTAVSKKQQKYCSVACYQKAKKERSS